MRQNKILDTNIPTRRKVWCWQRVTYPKFTQHPWEISFVLLMATPQLHSVAAACRLGNWGKLSENRIRQEKETFICDPGPPSLEKTERIQDLLHFFIKPTGFTEFTLTIDSCQSSFSPLKEPMKTPLHKKNISPDHSLFPGEIFSNMK